MTIPQAPAGYHTVNPFVITADAGGLIAFVIAVFGAREVSEARTIDDDGLILHSEVVIGDSIVMVADRKPDWPVTAGLLQVYVDDVAAALAAALERGARVVTEPTEFFGDVLSRVVDPWGNLWWIYQHSNETPDWNADAATDAADEAGWSSDPSPELTYIHDTLLEAMRGLPR